MNLKEYNHQRYLKHREKRLAKSKKEVRERLESEGKRFVICDTCGEEKIIEYGWDTCMGCIEELAKSTRIGGQKKTYCASCKRPFELLYTIRQKYHTENGDVCFSCMAKVGERGFTSGRNA